MINESPPVEAPEGNVQTELLVTVDDRNRYYEIFLRYLQLVVVLLVLQTAIMLWREGRFWNHCYQEAAQWDRDVADYIAGGERVNREDYPTFWRCVTQ